MYNIISSTYQKIGDLYCSIQGQPKLLCNHKLNRLICRILFLIFWQPWHHCTVDVHCTSKPWMKSAQELLVCYIALLIIVDFRIADLLTWNFDKKYVENHFKLLSILDSKGSTQTQVRAWLECTLTMWFLFELFFQLWSITNYTYFLPRWIWWSSNLIWLESKRSCEVEYWRG